MVLALNHGDAQTESFEQAGVVGRLRRIFMGAPQSLGPEGLRRLHCHELAAVQRLDDLPVADTLDRVGDSEGGHGPVGAGHDGLDDGAEQLTRGERPGGVVDDDDLGVRRNGGKATPDRGRPGGTAGHDAVGALAKAGRPTKDSGTTATTPRATEREASRLHSMTGRPPSRANCFGWPKRRPSPAATTIAQISTLTRRPRALR